MTWNTQKWDKKRSFQSNPSYGYICMNQYADAPCFLASMVRAMWWQISDQHRKRLTHFLSVFSPSGRKLIKKGLWFYLLSAPGPCVCLCVCVDWFCLSETVLSPTSLVSLAILPTFSQRHYPFSIRPKPSLISTAMQEGGGNCSRHNAEICNYYALGVIQIS